MNIFLVELLDLQIKELKKNPPSIVTVSGHLATRVARSCRGPREETGVTVADDLY